MARKRPSKARLRQRYLAAGWVGLGLLVGLGLGIGLWAYTQPPAADGDRRTAAAPPAMEEPEAPAPPAAPPEPPAPVAPGVQDRGPRAAIIIDDLGNNWAEAQAVNGLPYPVAVAVLPGTPYAARTARRAHERGKEVLAHMPMEPSDGTIRLGANFLRTGMPREQLLATLRANLDGIPYVQGINNHMGSRLTARARPMGWVMQALRERGLYFVDSRTTAATEGLSQARAQGLPAAQRDVFLDHEPTEPAVRAQFRELLKKARDQGTAIAIGHPHPATLKVLRDMLPEASRRGVEIVPLREVVAVRSGSGVAPGSLAYNRAPSGTPNAKGETP
jgi:hypothetical protein